MTNITNITKKKLIKTNKTLEISSVERVLGEKGTEHSVALGFAEQYKDKLKFDHKSSVWLMWTGTYWAVESTGLVLHYCRELASLLGSKTAERSSFVRGVETFCKNDPTFATLITEFDQDNYLFNCPDATYDLRTGESKPHDPKDLISNIAGCSPSKRGGYGKRFAQFLDEITEGDKHLQEYLQVSLGSCLSGAIESHWLMFWIGNGRNGKNTLGDAVMRIMGSYARKIPSSTLMRSKFDSHPTEIANLKGCRLAIASEVESGAFWNESRINELTGDVVISARFMRGDLFEFKRTFKLLIYGNHRPRLSTITEAGRSRLKLVRFQAEFTGDKLDPNLPLALKKEDSYILRWLMDGHAKWIENAKRLPYCKAIEDEINDYIDNQSTPFNWMSEKLKPSDTNFEKAGELYQKYKTWKEERGEQPQSHTLWGEEMKKRFKQKQTNKGMLYGVVFIGESVF